MFTARTPFIDVKPGVEHYDSMMWMYDAEVSTGWQTPKGPECRALSPLNRDAMAAFLYRQVGSTRVTLPVKSPFTDLKPSQEHYTAVIWAYQEGITTGWKMPNGTRQFRPVERSPATRWRRSCTGSLAVRAIPSPLGASPTCRARS